MKQNSTKKFDIDYICKEINIPPKPELLKKIHEETEKTNINLQKVSTLISHDVAISAAVIRSVNSSYFGLPNKVSSIPHAISLLCVEPTINLVSAFLLKQTMQDKCVMFPRFWDEASCIADFSAYFSSQLKISEPNIQYTLGLFHNVGIPLISQKNPDYLDILKANKINKDKLITDIEDEFFGTSHAIVGNLVSIEWGVDSSVREAILYHHDIEEIFKYSIDAEDNLLKEMLTVLKLAEHATDIIRTGVSSPEWEQFGMLITEFLGTSDEDIDTLIKDSGITL